MPQAKHCETLEGCCPSPPPFTPTTFSPNAPMGPASNSTLGHPKFPEPTGDPRAVLQLRTHCASPGLPQVLAPCALHSFCAPRASPYPWTHPVSPLKLPYMPGPVLDPILPFKSQPYGVFWPHSAPPGTPMKSGFPGQSRDWCVAGTYLLPVPMGHGEMESRLEPSEGHLFPPKSTHTGHSLGVLSHHGVTLGCRYTSPQHRLCSPALKRSSSWSPRCSWCVRAEP